ncbi:MAG: hypothetical protein OSJ43_07585 [Oscillospiraceae bacterium]|nr:hypothetical protein [Oscillospiraceae bacterium]
MFKWVRILGSQYLGFWVLGLIIFALQEIPYMVMPLFKLSANPIIEMRESSVFLDICEKVLGSSCIALMMFVVHNDAKFFSAAAGKERLFFCIAAGILLLNYLGWFLYFTGHQSVAVMLIFIVALPPLLYLFVGLWRKNTVLAITACVFLIVHFVHVSGNLKIT